MLSAQTQQMLVNSMGRYNTPYRGDFDVFKYIPEKDKFGGEKDKWTLFLNAWSRAERRMIERRDMSSLDMYLELKKVLKGPALDAVTGLGEDETAYDSALNLLFELYDQKETTLRLAARDWFESLLYTTKNYKEDIDQRARWARFFNTYRTSRGTEFQKLTAVFTVFMEYNMNTRWEREWTKLFNAKRDPDSCMGTTAGINELMTLISMVNDNNERAAKMSQANQRDKKPPPKTGSYSANETKKSNNQTKKEKAAKAEKAPETAMAAGAPYKKDQQKQKPKGNLPREHCIFCETGRDQYTYNHIMPRSCPILKAWKSNAQSLRDKVVDKGVCRNCFRSGHFANKCEAPDFVICGLDGCTGRHHPLFHPKEKKTGGGAHHAQTNNQQDDQGALVPYRYGGQGPANNSY